MEDQIITQLISSGSSIGIAIAIFIYMLRREDGIRKDYVEREDNFIIREDKLSAILNEIKSILQEIQRDHKEFKDVIVKCNRR